MKKLVETPEHERMKAISADSQKLGEFLEWLGEQGVVLARWGTYEELHPDQQSIEKRLAAYFKIDLQKIEAEKMALLESCKGWWKADPEEARRVAFETARADLRRLVEQAKETERNFICRFTNDPPQEERRAGSVAGERWWFAWEPPDSTIAIKDENDLIVAEYELGRPITEENLATAQMLASGPRLADSVSALVRYLNTGLGSIEEIVEEAEAALDEALDK